MDRQYYIKSGGELVAVTEEVYRAYQQPNWREKKQKEVRKRREESYELMLENGLTFLAMIYRLMKLFLLHYELRNFTMHLTI